MVGVERVELPTPAMSIQCSTTELYAHTIDWSLIAQRRRALTRRLRARKRFGCYGAAKTGMKLTKTLRAALQTRAQPQARGRAGETVWTALLLLVAPYLPAE